MKRHDRRQNLFRERELQSLVQVFGLEEVGPPVPGRTALGLRGKLTTGVLTITVIVIVGMTFVLLDKNRQDLTLQRTIEARTLANTTATAVRIFLEGVGDPSSIEVAMEQAQVLCQSAAASTNVDSVLVVNRELRAVAHSNPQARGFTIPADDDLLRAFNSNRTSTTVTDKSTLGTQAIGLPASITVCSPISVGGHVVGVVRLRANLESLEEGYSRYQRYTLRVIMIECLVIIAFIWLLLNMVVLRPIRRMVQVTKEIADGNIEERVEIATADEFGQLALAFNTMVDKLQRSYNKLSEYVADLESAYADIKKAQEELITSDKQASIGRLAAGVAHEIGNPLSSLLGYTEILMLSPDLDPDQRQYLEDMQHEIQRISRIVRDLLDFSRQRELRLHPTSINETLERTWRLLATLPEFHDVVQHFHFHPDLPTVLLDENLLQQVSTNIMVNAAHAMHGKGEIHITTEMDPTELRIIFRDSGPGVPPEIAAHLFEPFFTTKEPGRGTGLGLSVSQTLLERHGGTLTLDTVSAGAQFTIHLPNRGEEQEIAG